jgi:ribosomal protein S20
MPQHKSAKKRLRQSERKKAVNKSFKSNVNTEIKAIEKLISDKKTRRINSKTSNCNVSSTQVCKKENYKS